MDLSRTSKFGAPGKDPTYSVVSTHWLHNMTNELVGSSARGKLLAIPMKPNLHSAACQQRIFTLARTTLRTTIMLTALPLIGQRDPVLKQIDLPHRYYYREMYLPQLTTGPNSAAWSSDSRSLVYSMAGTLWRQSVDSGIAEQLTAGPGYDYQPDCSPTAAGSPM